MTRFLGLRAAAVVAVLVLLALFGLDRLSVGLRSAASAATPAQQIGMRVLLVSDSSDPSTPSGIAYGDWVNNLKREGVPYDSVVTSDASPGSVALPALSSSVPGGNEVANYEGVVVATSGAEGLSSAQWTALQTFEQHFSVRQVTAYAVPSSDYGLSAAVPGRRRGTVGRADADGGRSQGVSVPKRDLTRYRHLGLPGDPDRGRERRHADLGSEFELDARRLHEPRTVARRCTRPSTRTSTCSRASCSATASWPGWRRSTYFGTSATTWRPTSTTTSSPMPPGASRGMPRPRRTRRTSTPADALREVPADVTAAAKWSRQHNFRIDMLFNGGGSVAVANGDSLAARRLGVATTGSTGPTSTVHRHGPGHRSAAGSSSKPTDPPPASPTPMISAGSATPGITPTSTRAARPRTTSRPSSTRTPPGAPRRPRPATPSPAASG